MQERGGGGVAPASVPVFPFWGLGTGAGPPRCGRASCIRAASAGTVALRNGSGKPLSDVTDHFGGHVTWLLILRRRALPFAADEQVIQGGIELERDGSLSFEFLLPDLVVRDGRLVVAASLEDEQGAFQVLGRASR